MTGCQPRRARSTPVAAARACGCGLTVVRVDNGAIRTQQVVQLADAFAAQVLPYFDQYALSHRLWAPDGSALALPRRRRRRDDAGGRDPDRRICAATDRRRRGSLLEPLTPGLVHSLCTLLVQILLWMLGCRS